MGILDFLKGKSKEAQKQGKTSATLVFSELNASTEKNINKGNTKYVKSIQGDYAKTIFLWSLSGKPAPIRKRDEYPGYLFYECGIQNAPKYHSDLVEAGYFEPASINEKLSMLKVAELKTLLQQHGLVSTGKKEKLITTAIDGIPLDTLSTLFPQATYVLSEKGKEFLSLHEDYVKLKNHAGYQISHEEFDREKALCPGKSFNDVCWGIFNQRLLENGGVHGSQRNVFYNMFLLLKEEGRKVNALDTLLRVVYMDIEAEFKRELTSYKNNWITKKEMVENLQSACYVAPALVEEIGFLEDVYSGEIVDHLYKTESGPHVCPKELFIDLVTKIIDGTYDEVEFRNKLVKEIKKKI